jgi:hypothetical protein
MKILAIEKEINQVSESDYLPYLEDEARKVWDLLQKGIIREIYFTDDHCAVLILEADNKTHAREMIDQLPLVQNKLIDFELMALTAYSGFARLFKK